MRIISGKFKGKFITFLKSKTTRPLKDMVKENIFNILNHSKNIKVQIKNSSVLDLYSGVGSFGLECISRGAREVTFVENDSSALDVLKKNIDNLSVHKNTKIIQNKVENINNEFLEKKYDIIFLDPPYADNKFIKNLIFLQKNKIREKNHIVIIHREKNRKDNLDKIFNLIFEKSYGRSKVLFGTLL